MNISEIIRNGSPGSAHTRKIESTLLSSAFERPCPSRVANSHDHQLNQSNRAIRNCMQPLCVCGASETINCIQIDTIDTKFMLHRVHGQSCTGHIGRTRMRQERAFLPPVQPFLCSGMFGFAFHKRCHQQNSFSIPQKTARSKKMLFSTIS